jgi:hypothetical protein
MPSKKNTHFDIEPDIVEEDNSENRSNQDESQFSQTETDASTW